MKSKFFVIVLLAAMIVPAVSMAGDKINPFFKQEEQPEKVNRQMLEDLQSELRAIKASMNEQPSRSAGSDGEEEEGTEKLPPVPSAISGNVVADESAKYVITGRLSDGILLTSKEDDGRSIVVKNGSFIDGCYVRFPFFECPPSAPAVQSTKVN